MNNNYDLIQYFLNMMREFAISNPDKQITENFVYSNLIRFNINNNQYPNQNVKDNYDYWKGRYQNNSNIKVFEVESNSFLWFSNGKLNGNEIKLYIPMDYNHVQEGASRLFDFISSTNMTHQSKIASIIRNDNVVVRVTNLEDAKKVIDFVNSNYYIKEGMIKVNPFLPNCNGVGITMDNKFSFNSETSKLVSNFIEYMKSINRMDLITVDNFNSYIKNSISNVQDPDLKDIYTLLSKTTTKEFKLQDFVDHANNKLIDKYTDNRVRIVDPKYYLERCIRLTEKKHPGNSKAGLIQYLKSNPMYFTNDERAREGLIKYVKPRDLIPIMRTKLQENNIPIPQTDKELVEKYIDLVFVKNYVKEFEIIKEAYKNTLDKYQQRHADVAFEQLYLNNNILYFTNDFNDRTKLEKQVLPLDVKKIILNNIDLNGLKDINNISEILYRFKNVLEHNKEKLSNI